jgi:gluconolactonase
LRPTHRAEEEAACPRAPDRTSASHGEAGSPALGDAASGGTGGNADSGSSGWTCPAGPFGSPIPAGATPARIAGVPPSDSFNGMNANFGIIEGPVWIGDALYVSEITNAPNPPPSRILKVTPAGVVTVAISPSGSNGLAVDEDGELYGADDKNGAITRFDLSTGVGTPVVTTYMGKRFDAPNDLTIRSDGTIYFSDTDYQAVTPPPQASTGLYRAVPGSTLGLLLDGTLDEPNGVTLSLDEKTLYVTSVPSVYQYPVMSDGSLGPGTVFSQTAGGDGMGIDCAGNLYVATNNNVVVLSPTGTQIGELTVPATSVQSLSNVAFGGSDHQTLYITALGTGAQKGLFQVALSIPGMPY